MKRGDSQISLFQYLDYRKYLRDRYTEMKKGRAGFSFRTFSKQAGFRSPNFYKLVMDGERNLTEESLVPFLKGLRLNKQEQEFFRNLVFFNQAKTHEQKDLYYQRLLQSRKFSELKPLQKEQYEFYSTWYHPVIRELVASKVFDGTPEWLAERIYPSITPPQAQRSLELLEKLGLVQRVGDRWRQTSSVISTGPEVTSLALFNYHQNLLDLTKEVLQKVPAGSRDVSAMTLGVLRSQLPELKKRIQEFRQEILKFVSVDLHPEEVVQLDIQMFPLTSVEKIGGKS